MIHSAFLSAGVTLLEYDKADYDPNDVYYYPIQSFDYFYSSNSKIYLRPEKSTMEAFLACPYNSYEFLNVDMLIDPEKVIEILTKHPITP